LSGAGCLLNPVNIEDTIAYMIPPNGCKKEGTGKLQMYYGGFKQILQNKKDRLIAILLNSSGYPQKRALSADPLEPYI
jgi:hypothetical protein